jgi:hypothetical protein
MLFVFKYNWVSLNKPRTGSRVPEVAATNQHGQPAANTLHNKTMRIKIQFALQVVIRRLHKHTSTIASTKHHHDHAFVNTNESVVGHGQNGQRGQVTQRFERACDCPTPRKHPNNNTTHHKSHAHLPAVIKQPR